MLTLKHVYNKYGYYDWYLKADDDTFIFVDNLREFIEKNNDKHDKNGRMYGYKFKLFVKNGYMSGGAGYLLNKKALSKLGSKLDKNIMYCPHYKEEDISVSNCMNLLGIVKMNSTDKLGRERFHPFNITAHYFGLLDNEFELYSANKVKKVQLFNNFENLVLFYFNSNK